MPPAKQKQRRSSGDKAGQGGSRLPLPPNTMARAPHAEEVVLADGVEPPRMTSTTGRRLRAAPPVDPVEPQRATPNSSAGGGSYSGQKRADAANDLSCLDKYGFRVTAMERAAEERYDQENALSAQMLKKWEEVSQSWDSWAAADPSAKKKMCRKGVPQHLRAKVWQLLLGTYAASFTVEKRGRYEELKNKPLESAEVAGVIDRDLDRTFPTHYLFEDGGPKTGQGMLRNMLRAYANYNPLVGYCQGMGFLAATMLLQIEHEEDAFWAFCALMEKPPFQFEGLFEPGFPQLRCCFYVLEHLIPETKAKKIGRRLKEWSIEPSFYATHWFLTAFAYYLNFGLVSRIWDMFLCEGWKPIYRVAIALLILEEKKLLSQPGEGELLMALKDVQESKEPNQLLKTALGVKFKTAKVVKYTREFRLQ